MPQRAVGVIIKENKILLMRRMKNGQEYYVFPGGGVKEGESTETAIIREIREELSLDAKIDKLLFEIENQGRQEYYYLIKEFSGQPQLGGEGIVRFLLNQVCLWIQNMHKFTYILDSLGV